MGNSISDKGMPRKMHWGSCGGSATEPWISCLYADASKLFALYSEGNHLGPSMYFKGGNTFQGVYICTYFVICF